jgi:hypothetical protein
MRTCVASLLGEMKGKSSVLRPAPEHISICSTRHARPLVLVGVTHQQYVMA